MLPLDCVDQGEVGESQSVVKMTRSEGPYESSISFYISSTSSRRV